LVPCGSPSINHLQSENLAQFGKAASRLGNKDLKYKRFLKKIQQD
jgi:hypothetical protein